MECQGVSVPPQSKITAATAMDAIVRTAADSQEPLFPASAPGASGSVHCGCTPLTVWVECGGPPETAGAAGPGILAISRTDTGCQ